MEDEQILTDESPSQFPNKPEDFKFGKRQLEVENEENIENGNDLDKPHANIMNLKTGSNYLSTVKFISESTSPSILEPTQNSQQKEMVSMSQVNMTNQYNARSEANIPEFSFHHHKSNQQCKEEKQNEGFSASVSPNGLINFDEDIDTIHEKDIQKNEEDLDSSSLAEIGESQQSKYGQLSFKIKQLCPQNSLDRFRTTSIPNRHIFIPEPIASQAIQNEILNNSQKNNEEEDEKDADFIEKILQPQGITTTCHSSMNILGVQQTNLFISGHSTRYTSETTRRELLQDSVQQVSFSIAQTFPQDELAEHSQLHLEAGLKPQTMKQKQESTKGTQISTIEALSSSSTILKTNLLLSSSRSDQLKYKKRQQRLNLQIDLSLMTNNFEPNKECKFQGTTQKLTQKLQQPSYGEILAPAVHQEIYAQQSRDLESIGIESEQVESVSVPPQVHQIQNFDNIFQNEEEENEILSIEEEIMANQIFSQTVLIQILIIILNLLIYFILSSEQLRPNFLAIIGVFLFLFFLGKAIKIIRLIKKQKSITMEEKFNAIEIMSLSMISLSIFAIVKVVGRHIIYIAVYFPFVHVIWWKASLDLKKNSPFYIKARLWFRVYLFFQMLLVALKYDGYIPWGWLVVFFPSLMLVIGLLFYLTQILVLTLWNFFSACCYSSSYLEFNGLFWGFISFSGYTSCYYFIITSSISYFENNSTESLEYNLIYCLFSNVAILVFDFIYRNKIKKYIGITNRGKDRQAQRAEEFRQFQNRWENQASQHALPHANQGIQHSSHSQEQTESKNKQEEEPMKQLVNADLPLFLVRFSSSYFQQAKFFKTQVPQNKSLPKSKRNLEKCQQVQEKTISENQQLRTIQPFQLPSLQNQIQTTSKMNDDSITKAKQNLQKEMKSKQQHANQLIRMTDTNDNESANQLTTERNMNLVTIREQFLINSPKTAFVYNQRSFAQTKAQENVGFSKKAIKTETITIPEIVSPKSSIQSDKEGQTCLICFEAKSNSVLMPCGHGGICQSCSWDILKKTGLCFLCRTKIENIYEIETDTKGNYLKVLAITTAQTKKQPNNVLMGR